MITNCETSADVPAVVGIRISGGARHADGVDAFEFEDVAAVSDRDTNALAAIHRAAATDRDDHVAMVFAIQLGAEHDFFDPGIGGYGAVDEVLKALGQQAGFDIGDPAGGDDAGIADHHHLACAEGFRVIADAVTTAGAEDDFRGHEFTQLVEALAHIKRILVVIRE